MSALKSVRTGIVCVAGLALTAMATEPGARALTADGDRLMNENGLADAVHAYRSAIRLSTSSGDLIQTGIALDHLGIAYNLLGDDQNAETSFTRAINAFLAGEGEPGEDLVRSYMDLAALYRKLNRYSRAHKFAEQAVAVRRRDPENPRETALALILVAAIEGDGHRTGDAISHCREALDTLDRAGLGSSREWIGAANNPANILVATGRPEEGRTYLCEALTRGGRILLAPADTLILAQISANLAHVDLQLRYFEEAGANFRCALETFERCLGCNHPRTGELLVDYARLCWATKRKMEAKQFESRARECLNSHRYGLRDNTVDVSDLIGRSR